MNAQFKSLSLFVTALVVVITSVSLSMAHVKPRQAPIEFDLTDQYGQTVSAHDLQGRYLLVFFGFTHCNGICPTQMSKLSNVMTELTAKGRTQHLQPVFISVDPERDSVERVRLYLNYFHSDFIGLTGNRSALTQAANSFQTLLEAAPEPNIASKYQVTHSSIVHLVDPFGRIKGHLSNDLSAHEMVDYVLSHI